MIELTQEQEVQRSYDAAMDSVNLINNGKPEDMSTEDWASCVARNKKHLEIQIAKGAEYYGTNDLQPLKDAITK